MLLLCHSRTFLKRQSCYQFALSLISIKQAKNFTCIYTAFREKHDFYNGIYSVPHGAIAEEILFAGSNLQNPKRFAEEKFKQMTRAVVKSSLLEVVILQGLKWFHHQSLYGRGAYSTTTKFSSAELIAVLSCFPIHHCRIRIKRGRFSERASIDVELKLASSLTGL
ncbi:hypothetical protein CEXT_9491 [Caerostris extrusa]|uniref:Uncharacterized protein n=1 Tax=Caerostris extrusa TaxID=172846 RepID=A0AAV4P1M7_CAEEX|nr:hypothetical protein CEXT_9491 [Caerostris extrusa]